ncbi:oligosaccharide flippase family protein [Rhizobium sp. NFR12]|uniref:oligosaccharide flippase family protein n=1 Tax=Rhizobium sp. NFR12 TaxID=1566261 RepID=UPI0008A7D2A2|nr:oligosaccharide flippase family protein [Rhizobium sp. NFR12]SEH27962.1 Membrane protein involved in the export of O-antigen and teichoic acid [Rhizobium sp. NFR12]
MSYLKLAIKGTSWSLAQVLVERLTQTVVFLIAAALLGPHEFGVAALSTAPAVIMASTLQSGSQIIIQRRLLEDEFINSVFGLFLLLGLCGSALLLIASALLGHWETFSGLSAMVAVTSIAPLVAAFAVVPEGLLARDFAYKVLAVRKSAGLLVGGIVCCSLAFSGFGAWSIVAQVVIAPVIAAIISIAVAGWKPTALPALNAMRSAMRFSFSIIGMSAVTQINIRSADLVVGLVATPTATGVFRLSRTVLDLATSLFLNPINNVLLPIFSRMAGDRKRMTSTMWRSCGVTSLIASIPFVASAFSAPIIALTIFGEKWPQLPETITLMLLSLPFIAVIVPLQTFLVATGHPGFAFRNNLYQAIANISMIAVGAYFGIFWAAAMFSLRCCLGTVALLFTVEKTFGDIAASDGMKTMLPAVLAVGVIGMLAVVLSTFQLDLQDRRVAVAFTLTACGMYAVLSAFAFHDRIKAIIEIWKSRRG